MSEDRKEPEIIPFATSDAWVAWLAKNYTRQEGIWLQMYKKGSDVPTITYDQALDGALCYGWIDGQMKKFDEKSYLQKFTPRRPRSMWSKRNREYVARLIDAGLMREPGLKEIEAAKKDGRWNAAYDKPSDMPMPEDFLQALAKSPRAEIFFKTLNKANTYAIAWRLQTAKKPETRQKRFDMLLAMLERGEKLH
jgi:uncharacterized protein YdeI (YjbR/CyaY-like superfamily)